MYDDMVMYKRLGNEKSAMVEACSVLLLHEPPKCEDWVAIVMARVLVVGKDLSRDCCNQPRARDAQLVSTYNIYSSSSR